MSFFDDVYRLVKTIPEGRVVTYGMVAEKMGTKDARKVGWALHGNKSSSVPCHRVVNREGKLAKNFAFDGDREQYSRLLAEGVCFNDDSHVDLEKSLAVGW